MRTILFISGTVLVVGIGGLLIWRPTLALALALLGGAISVWRMHRPHRVVAAPNPVTADQAPVMPEAEEAEEAEPPAAPAAELLVRIRGTGWVMVAARSPSPWLLATSGGVRVALRPAPISLWATEEDIADAMAAKALDRAQYAAIICEYRPSDEVAALAKDSGVHIVNIARLDAYLALAGSFKPAQTNTTTQRRISA